MYGRDILSKVDHTLLKPDATWDAIKVLCDEAVAYKAASVCIPPNYVKRVADEYPDLVICTVVGFPLGYQTTEVKLAGHKIFDEYQEAKELGINTRPVVVGPFTFLQLSDFEDGVKAEDFVDSFVAAYQEVFAKLAELGATRIQLDEPALVKDLTSEEKALFLNLYNKLLADKKGLEVLIQTYFGDVRDVYNDLVNLPVDGIGLDFVEGKKLLNSLKVASQLIRPFMLVL